MPHVLPIPVAAVFRIAGMPHTGDVLTMQDMAATPGAVAHLLLAGAPVVPGIVPGSALRAPL